MMTFRGVNLTDTGKWKAWLALPTGEVVFLGSQFLTQEAAIEARLEAEKKYGYNVTAGYPNIDLFAPTDEYVKSLKDKDGTLWIVCSDLWKALGFNGNGWNNAMLEVPDKYCSYINLNDLTKNRRAVTLEGAILMMGSSRSPYKTELTKWLILYLPCSWYHREGTC